MPLVLCSWRYRYPAQSRRFHASPSATSTQCLSRGTDSAQRLPKIRRDTVRTFYGLASEDPRIYLDHHGALNE